MKTSLNLSIAALSIAIVSAIFSIAALQQSQPNLTKTEYDCKQYNSLPEKYQDRVPDVCLGQFFDHKKQEAAVLREQQIKAATGKPVQ